ncbi:hypothetical protein Baya_2945 [Bagarius yarrelli]|uniref:Uncharacterized protein n=1 Tax=Bagarius yarrelli TaxID=175774 RepID=A0A556TQZ1_BAGYA|nr:hypothetical protein Baya_2945 [Bagarius yarrelli]
MLEEEKEEEEERKIGLEAALRNPLIGICIKRKQKNGMQTVDRKVSVGKGAPNPTAYLHFQGILIASSPVAY